MLVSSTAGCSFFKFPCNKQRATRNHSADTADGYPLGAPNGAHANSSGVHGLLDEAGPFLAVSACVVDAAESGNATELAGSIDAYATEDSE